jgi:hypothetical protein
MNPVQTVLKYNYGRRIFTYLGQHDAAIYAFLQTFLVSSFRITHLHIYCTRSSIAKANLLCTMYI